MATLRDKFEELCELLIHHRDDLSQDTGVPFVRLIYPPDDERECRRLTHDLRKRLTAQGFGADEIHCGELLFQHYRQRGERQYELRLKTAEGTPQQAKDEIGRRAETALIETILDHARRAPPTGNLILSEVGMLYPFAHLEGVLQKCENDVRIPLVLLYPATIENERILFMGKRETGYYRTRDLK